MGTCSLCGATAPTISSALDLCVDCIRSESAAIEGRIADAYRKTRVDFGLPPAPPRDQLAATYPEGSRPRALVSALNNIGESVLRREGM